MKYKAIAVFLAFLSVLLGVFLEDLTPTVFLVPVAVCLFFSDMEKYEI